MSKIERMREKQSRDFLEDFMYGCGNHSCKVKKPIGQGTNAGCNCHMKIRKLYNSVFDTLTSELEELKMSKGRNCVNSGGEHKGWMCPDCVQRLIKAKEISSIGMKTTGNALFEPAPSCLTSELEACRKDKEEAIGLLNDISNFIQCPVCHKPTTIDDDNHLKGCWLFNYVKTHTVSKGEK